MTAETATETTTAKSSTDEDSGEDTPFFKIIKGSLDDHQLAALTAVLLSLPAITEQDSSSGSPGSENPRRSLRREHRLRSLPAPGPGAWRRSAWF